jgi:hypothetical protein
VNGGSFIEKHSVLWLDIQVRAKNMTMTTLDPKGREIVAKIWNDFQRDRMELETEEAQANPKAYRTSHIFDNDTSYRYYQAKKGRARYCYSTKRNVAGYFLIWREVETKKHVRRDQFDSTKTKKDAMSECRRRSGITD